MTDPTPHTTTPPPSRAGDLSIRASSAATVVAIGAIAAVVSFRHALGVVRAHGETGFTVYLTPLTVDGLVFTASMVLLDAARSGYRPPLLARLALGLGIAATVAVNVLHGLAHGPIGSLVAAWPAVTLVLVVELLMSMIRHRRTSTRSAPAQPSLTPAPVQTGTAQRADRTRTLHAVPVSPTHPVPASVEQVQPVPLGVDPARVRAAQVFADDLKAGEVPSIRRIKSALRCGQGKAAQVQEYLSTLTPATLTPTSQSDDAPADVEGARS